MASSLRQSRHATSADCGGDTTMTKIFVGGLAWETRRDSMRRYFEQFGEIVEAVVITDKQTGRSKGYGFVTFKEPESASRACSDPSPIIDGRRANCNLASEGHHRPPPPPVNPPPFQVCRTVRPIIQVAPHGYQRPSTYLNQSTPNYTFPFWYSGVYSQENVYPYGYYNLNGGSGLQQYQYYTGPGTSNNPSMIPGYYNLYNCSPYAQPNQGGGGVGVGYGLHYGQVVPYHYLTQHYAPGIVPLPPQGLSTTAASPTGAPGGSVPPPSGPDQMNSA